MFINSESIGSLSKNCRHRRGYQWTFTCSSILNVPRLITCSDVLDRVWTIALLGNAGTVRYLSVIARLIIKWIYSLISVHGVRIILFFRNTWSLMFAVFHARRFYSTWFVLLSEFMVWRLSFGIFASSLLKTLKWNSWIWSNTSNTFYCIFWDILWTKSYFYWRVVIMAKEEKRPVKLFSEF